MNFIKKYFLNKEIKKFERLILHRSLVKEPKSTKEWLETINQYSHDTTFYKETEEEKKLTDNDILKKIRKLKLQKLKICSK